MVVFTEPPSQLFKVELIRHFPLLIGSESMTDQAQFFVGWGTLSLINAGLAQSKNRSGLFWWIASLFFGPFATFLIVILDRVGPPAA
jgi:hypothetical protein